MTLSDLERHFVRVKRLYRISIITLGMGAWLTPKNMLLRNVCYQTKFRRSRTNRMGVGKGVPNFFLEDAEPSRLGMGGYGGP